MVQWYVVLPHNSSWSFVGPIISSKNCCCINTLFSLSSGPEVDECQINPYICGMGICYNTAEGYTCHCNEGYRLDDAQTTCVGEESNGQSCLLRSKVIFSMSNRYCTSKVSVVLGLFVITSLYGCKEITCHNLLQYKNAIGFIVELERYHLWLSKKLCKQCRVKAQILP